MSLSKRAVSGLLWTFAQQFGAQAITFITSVILARILLPSDFGLIGMLALFMGVGNVLIDGGLTNSLIRSQDVDQSDYSSVFFINIIGSVVIYLIVFFCAPLISGFYHQPVLTGIIRVYTLSFIINAFATVQTTRLTRELKFKLQMLMQLPSLIISGTVGVILALKGFGVWSLVWLNIINSIIFVSLHWLLSGWYPQWIFNKKKLLVHLNFGYKLTLSGTLDIVFENIYNIVIGRFFLASSLGFYTRAQTISMLPVQSISAALNKVTYSLFATIQDDNIRLKKAYKTIMLAVVFWVTIVMICLQVVSEPLFKLLLTTKWLPAVPYFKVLCITAILYPLHLYNLNVLLVKGEAGLYLKLEVYKKIIIVIGVITVTQFGIFGLLYFQVVFSVMAFFLNSWYSGRLIGYPVKEQLKDLLPIFITGVVTAAFCLFLQNFFTSLALLSDLVRIIIMGATCFATYTCISYIIKMPALFDTFTLINKTDNT
ncbi:lipopolysaccharide biosynthesis protein [Mucilaginibacter sp. ZT4R22]|uniref:Lipopolysaccharide biosynthesis protein n=1 Tax=Mucilaginibacter pankratovii TaxID=2772110 RepID=A0ABR7WPV1_9SPHI|nr:lipopolysaccharide biosynthesis protein [Mucilaginibacter pankratovii]MBD1364351.1 lipopolysaccharide biosynthesis protein [Mucilaginibacter pankratovii]